MDVLKFPEDGGVKGISLHQTSAELEGVPETRGHVRLGLIDADGLEHVAIDDRREPLAQVEAELRRLAQILIKAAEDLRAGRVRVESLPPSA